MADLTANESLCNNIIQFKTVLAKHEPNVQAPSFGLKKLSKASKKAFVSVINDCLEALLALNLQTELEKIIAKYEPTAKKIKEAEEKAQQEAVKASSLRPKTPAPMKTTVRRGEEPGYYEFGGIEKPAGYPPYGPSYAPEKKAEAEEKGGKAKEKEGAKPEGKGEAKKEEKKGPETKKEEAKETETTKKIENKAFEFGEQLTNALELIDSSRYLKNLKAAVQPASTVKAIKDITSEIAGVTAAIQSSCKIVESASGPIADLPHGAQRDRLTKKFKDAWGQARGDLLNFRDIVRDVSI